jgi:hypothetical protein
MENTQDNVYNNNNDYILMSKKKIDDFISNNDYKKAFGLLILVLDRLDTNNKKELINYYKSYRYIW